MEKYPLKLIPVPKEILWGGNRLKHDYGKYAPFDSIAESWELTVREDGCNLIANGIYTGTALSAVVKNAPSDLLGTACEGMEHFPLLIKFIDAAERLSVQVHPDDAYAMKKENTFGKTEMWVVLEADEGAKLVYGLREGCSPSDLAAAADHDTIDDVLFYANVKKGDVFFIPAGQVHALGGGILVAEIQQNSNITYRVFDYNRRQSDGTLRPLHRQQAMEVIQCRTDAELDALRYEKCAPSPGLLCASKHFTVRKMEVDGSLSLTVGEECFLSLLVLDADHGKIQCGSASYSIAKGDSWFLPAGLGEIAIRGERTELLLTSL